MITARFVLLILAFVCFFMSAMQISAPRTDLKGLGLALWVLAEMIRS